MISVSGDLVIAGTLLLLCIAIPASLIGGAMLAAKIFDFIVDFRYKRREKNKSAD